MPARVHLWGAAVYIVASFVLAYVGLSHLGASTTNGQVATTIGLAVIGFSKGLHSISRYAELKKIENEKSLYRDL
ncbi:hypothetical protein CJD38_17480 [Stenotrophobium rhamnosiphilum]|uniref:Uncharacterized protein n=1 Tax=Stenotrophobium rhamnosiphilum TaxID=2029166 RepID=A0A2T5MBL8_9GAMM|nr:hypothetical protein CJD38_17480 [Stenotrophobium rhamnosiphilum]